MGEFEQLVIFDSSESVNMGDAVADLDHGAYVNRSHRSAELLYLLPDNGSDILSSCHLFHSFSRVLPSSSPMLLGPISA